jgi:carboxy-terminal domain RNA polymerase II polypeptide A small phosphatase
MNETIMGEETDKILLILDLDETLIHSTEEIPAGGSDFTVFHYHVVKRPHVDYFIQECSRYFRLAVWSTGSDDYAEKIVENIFTSTVKPEFVWGRSKANYQPSRSRNEIISLGFSHYDYIKRLKKIRPLGYSLERTLMVDDTPHKLKENYGNAIYIREFNGEPEDEELLYLLSYLMTIKDCPDVLHVEKRNWRKNTLLPYQ